MINKEVIDHVRTIADPILSDQGMELVDIEYRREATGWVLRLYIDKEEGVTVNDCAQISREIDRNLDVEDFISTPYMLEISSPGLTRPLKGEKDFIKYKNRLVKVKTYDPIENRRNFKGKLLEIFGNQIEIEMDGEIIQIPISKIAKANLEIEF